jgi:hypothetical protein
MSKVCFIINRGWLSFEILEKQCSTLHIDVVLFNIDNLRATKLINSDIGFFLPNFKSLEIDDMDAETISCKDTIGLHCDCAWGQVYFHPFFIHFNSISSCAISKEIKQ